MKVVKLLLCFLIVFMVAGAPSWAAGDGSESVDPKAAEQQADTELEGMTVIATKTPKAPLC